MFFKLRTNASYKVLMMTEKIRPCPFCQAQPVMKEKEHHNYVTQTKEPSYRFECDCGVKSHWYPDKGQLQGAWNFRPVVGSGK